MPAAASLVSNPMGCEDCGDGDARMWLGDANLCDRCFNDRVSAATGLPRLAPAPVEPVVLTGADGRRHRLRYRVMRAPVGVEVRLEEVDVALGEGYEFAVLGDPDADVAPLLERVLATARVEVARRYLEPAEHRSGWVVGDEDEVAGRFVWNDNGENGRPFNVVVDGRVLSWEELGEALEPYEGWNFRLVIEDRVQEGRTDADVIDIADAASSRDDSMGDRRRKNVRSSLTDG